MREIKYKLYIKKYNSFEELVSIDFDEEIVCYYLVDEHDKTTSLETAGFNDIELVQDTGKQDVNKVNIHDGDIVIEKAYPFYGDAPEITSSSGECKELNYVGIVTWDDESTGYFLDYKIVSDRVRGSACGEGIGEYISLEVIGNVYQNKELLGDRND